jgi:SAM-dependent methyltransferase
MRTAFVRKSSLETRWWKSNYLIASTLQRHLADQCALLEGDLLDLGCGNRPYRPLLTRISRYVPYDLDVGSSTPEVVGRAENLPFASSSFDSVLCTQVLEHVPEPWRTVEEIARVLRPGGKLLLSTPQAEHLHEAPYDFYRYTRYGLEHLCQRSGLRLLSIMPQGGTWMLVGQIVNNLLWRDAPTMYTPAWWAGRAATTLLNGVALGLDALWHDPTDTMNHVVLAERVGLP